MSDQTVIHEGNCVCNQEWIEVSGKAPIEMPHSVSNDCNSYLLQDLSLENYADNKEIKGTRNMPARLLNFFAMLRNIFFAKYGEGSYHQNDKPDTSVQVIHTSNGWNIQPMIWDPEGIFKQRNK